MLGIGLFMKYVVSTSDYVTFKKGKDNMDFPRGHSNATQIVI